MRIKLEDSIAMLVDYQEKLMPAIHNHEKVIEKTVQLLTGLKIVGCPVMFTQQYTKGLGMTVPEITETQEQFGYLEKITYSCLDTEEIRKELETHNRKTVILAGVEAHICVMQTARDLIAQGYKVCIVTDCTSSRTEADLQVGMERMKQEGVFVTSVEAVLFELLEKAGTPEFKAVSKLIK
ncbi:hydrolase [[Clostridium] polysaccharolyticum]|jgi:nicotinamidase-related amidase|uniref:Nicotinamidase-related amidase n=1 Tax=[Clostridium] polysaccharolyticum TaxID=29364 RepID=A0A1H9YGX0_9FIRM|nr:hydrolase [[Clostridium] polysaccharolyticum]SES68185.1 Nicotinamidase-related amidase [[Clostridium] polysaccharolyticum]